MCHFCTKIVFQYKEYQKLKDDQVTLFNRWVQQSYNQIRIIQNVIKMLLFVTQ